MINKQSFIKGTIILMTANAISKILGAVFKIPLTYLLKEEGMAIYNTAFSVYIMLLSFIISGMPLAISKMVAEETARKKPANVRKIITVSTILLSLLGILGSAALWFGANFFSFAMKEPKSVFCLKIIAPSVFFVALGTVYKSCYQGLSNMLPTAISQVIEAFVKLAAGYALALYYSKLAAEYTAAAAIMGVTIGEIIATFILFVLYLPHRFCELSGHSDMKSRDILYGIGTVAIPAICAAAVSAAMNLADISIIRTCLERIHFSPESAEKFLLMYSSYTDVFDNLPQTLKITQEGSRWLYGAYSGYALTVFHLPIGILASLGVSILPVIAGAIAADNRIRAELYMRSAIKLTLIICLPAAFCIALFSDPILSLLFKNTASAQMLSFLAPCLVFISLTQIFNAISNAGGKIIAPFFIGFAGAAVKLLCNVIFITRPEINMLGTVIGANISYFLVMLLSFGLLRKQFPACCGFFKDFSKIFFCAAISAFIMNILYTPFTVIFSAETVSLLLCIAAGGVAYALLMLFTGCISDEELKIMRRKS